MPGFFGQDDLMSQSTGMCESDFLLARALIATISTMRYLL